MLARTLAAASLGALVIAAGGPAVPVSPCIGSMLTGTFSVIPDSAGAGNIVYALRLRNHTTKTCFVSGLVGLRLLGKTGRALPTHVMPAFRPGLTAVRVVLHPGGRAKTTARFSPDVPGTNEPISGRQCEPTGYRVRVTPPPGGGTLIAPIAPPTPVCERGDLSLSALSPG